MLVYIQVPIQGPGKELARLAREQPWPLEARVNPRSEKSFQEACNQEESIEESIMVWLLKARLIFDADLPIEIVRFGFSGG
jgi:hypothetical protein